MSQFLNHPSWTTIFNSIVKPLGLLILALILSFILLVGFLIGGAIFMGFMMASSEVVQHKVNSPDGQITALVIEDDCGATCGCQMRIDLKSDSQYLQEVYRSWTACDANVTWVSPTELYILDDEGRQEQIDTQLLGLSP
jgi:hypothetical protein